MGNYTNGSNLLLKVGTKALGSCSSHDVDYKAETKQIAVKPEASAPKGSGKWMKTIITSLSISISGEGLVLEGEKETTYAELLGMWKAGEPVEVACFHRGGDETPYIKGKFLLTNLKESSPAGEDTKYNISLVNACEPDVFDESKFEETQTVL